MEAAVSHFTTLKKIACRAGAVVQLTVFASHAESPGSIPSMA